MIIHDKFVHSRFAAIWDAPAEGSGVLSPTDGPDAAAPFLPGSDININADVQGGGVAPGATLVPGPAPSSFVLPPASNVSQSGGPSISNVAVALTGKAVGSSTSSTPLLLGAAGLAAWFFLSRK